MLGKTLLIVNPTARSGRATEAAAHAVPILETYQHESPSCESLTVYHTLMQGDGMRYSAKNAHQYQTVIALGGDGLINEIVNGLMQLDYENRPQLGIIPCGNGDDFARSLNISRKPQESIQQLLHARSQLLDLACVNGRWYHETLSFGLDAAIALQTMKLRQKTNRTGTSLYLQCGIDQLKNHRDIHCASISLDGNAPFETSLYLMAVQNGPYYGGGFQICPQANPHDGLLDICYATPPISLARAALIFLKAKQGKHLGNPHIHTMRAAHIVIDFADSLPIQVDGEPLEGTHFDIGVARHALNVLAPVQTA